MTTKKQNFIVGPKKIVLHNIKRFVRSTGLPMTGKPRRRRHPDFLVFSFRAKFDPRYLIEERVCNEERVCSEERV